MRRRQKKGDPQAEEVIRTFSAGDYAGVISMMDEKMQAAMTPETLEAAKEKTCADGKVCGFYMK